MEFNTICEKIENFGKENWLYLTTALAGEVGELCNLVKKFERDGFPKYDGGISEFYDKLDGEIADIFIYLVLFARVVGTDLEQAILDKIAVVKKRREGKT